MFENVTIRELLEGYAIYKELLDNNILKIDIDKHTHLIDCDQALIYLENQNLQLKKQLDNVIREANNGITFNDSADYETYLWRCLAYAKGYDYEKRYDQKNSKYLWEWEDLLANKIID